MSSSRLVCVWNKASVQIYVDGQLYETVTEPIEEPFVGLNFNPVKQFKTALPSKQIASVFSVSFSDKVNEASNALITGDLKDYFIGCFKSSLSTDSQVKNQQECKNYCAQSENTVSLIFYLIP